MDRSYAPTPDVLTRHKASIVLDLKHPSALSLLRSVLRKADVLIDPYRPGTLESLGLKSEKLLQENPRLIIARLSGFRRDGPYAHMAGHDINYLAVSGVLSQLGRAGEPPYAPANILADFAGGGLMCALGIVLALVSRQQTGKGQVVEANMVDGSAYLGTFMRLLRKTPVWDRPRGENMLDGGCPWYDTYECKDGGFMAVGALEPKFFGELIGGLELGERWMQERNDRSRWPELREEMRLRFLEKSRKEWEQVFDGTDACCTPIIGQDELDDNAYEQRPAVVLTRSPSKPNRDQDSWSSHGLSPGCGGEEVLRQWLGWRQGIDFAIGNSGLVKIDLPKL